MRFNALLWSSIIFCCIASLRFLAYQQWFLSQDSKLNDNGTSDGEFFDFAHHHSASNHSAKNVNDLDNEHNNDHSDPKYWDHWCPRKVFIGDSYDGWMICEPDDKRDLAGAHVYSLGIDPTLNDGKGGLEWENQMAKTYRTVHHVWDSALLTINTTTNVTADVNVYMHPYDIDVRYVDNSPAETTTNLTLDAMMHSQGHKELAILKLDLSKKTNIGKELELIDVWDSLAYFIPADQVYVQFHHEVHAAQDALIHAVLQMHVLGFRVFHRNERAFSFIRV